MQGCFDAVQQEVHTERHVPYDSIDEEGWRAADMTAATAIHVLSYALQIDLVVHFWRIARHIELQLFRVVMWIDPDTVG